MSDEIKIYVACLAAYNNGKLHGKWIDATQELDDMQDQINQMLSSSAEPDAEEFAIHDYEGFGGYGVSEYEGIQSVHDIDCFIEEHPEIGGELLSHFGGSLDDAKKAAEELTDGTTEIPEHLQYYIDYERMGRDMDLSGDIYTIETAHDEVHIFWAH